ncbi:hypothetical protein BAUCODRAFT_124562 [Baudoinia panamericana UAMH 10762]|uniref:FAD-binding PCMH-type domain-containing protein n=1 Tax=Baudoinia panamericana (strain UAMH 10762) TaxID=717646 RepID=M2MQP2_BAUPA|nr:uncharacterized protein BAUCODRAFT_124562 [Baudoinia panamericana UAMH 10762]EMC93808.1 hypothetical protein BAUCODRAFT_124562 [Baudoinia panamericana UAMH 10762]
MAKRRAVGLLLTALLQTACIGAEYKPQFAWEQEVFSANATAQASLTGCAAACTLLEWTAYLSVNQPNTFEYDGDKQSYWSAQQASVSPRCFVQPNNAEEVAAIIRILERTDCPFAVRSGGHGAFTGASNIPDGVTIDLRRLNEVNVSEDRSTTRVGAGNHWIDVYDRLTPMNLSVVGGRVTGIGVGGLTLGGGISFFSGRRGWACDGVRNYELVTADGSILDVNYKSYPDYYWALRGGGNNFGIVTHFDLETFEQGPMWGGVTVNSMEHNASLIQALVDFTNNSPTDPDGANWVAFVYAQTYGQWIASTELVYAKPVENPAILKNFTAIPNIHSTLRFSNLTDLSREVNQSNPDGMRQTWTTMTFKNDPRVMQASLDIWKEEILPIQNITGLVPALVFQSIPVDVIRHFSKNGGNCLGMDLEDGPLILVNIATMWASTSDDEAVLSTLERLTERSTAKAEELGLSHKYLYQNYAGQYQDVYSSYGETNRQRLLEISKKYDPKQVFQRLQPGYFKLGA